MTTNTTFTRNQQAMDLAEKHYGKVAKIARAFNRSYPHVSVADLTSYLNEEIIKIAHWYKPERNANQDAYFNGMLRNKAITFVDSGYAQYNKVFKPFSELEEDFGDDDGKSFEVPDLTGVHAIDDLLDGMDNKEVFAQLFAHSTDLQKQIMVEFLRNPQASNNQIADIVGVHHMKVKRELGKLAKVIG